MTVPEEGKWTGCRSQGVVGWGVSRALGPFQTFRDNRTNCSELPAAGLSGWLLLSFIKLHLPFLGRCNRHCQHWSRPFYLCVVRSSHCISACSARQARGAGNRCPPSLTAALNQWLESAHTFLTPADGITLGVSQNSPARWSSRCPQGSLTWYQILYRLPFLLCLTPLFPYWRFVGPLPKKNNLLSNLAVGQLLRVPG